MWAKICGVTDPALARKIAQAGPSAIGLNFYRPSPRCVAVDVAAQIARALPAHVEPIGVFVNHSVDDVLDIARTVGLRTVQLHGDEEPAQAAEVADAGLQIIRAFRVDDSGLGDLEQELEQYRDLRVELRGCLVDAKVAGSYGGTGHAAPWKLLAAQWRCDWPPLILAGGLRPENVRAAIDAVRPWGVDTASGVEASPGRQDLEKVRQFLEAAQR
ncbi:MAG: phosphoribosylanthranilate isomerase [Planctomycetaceae bacterium]|nr:phosphoribosylanthranilate isomerase [Planctomycetaceae bacterium]